MELIKDYECTIEYFPRKANVETDALRRKSDSSIAHMQIGPMTSFIILRGLNVGSQLSEEKVLITTL